MNITLIRKWKRNTYTIGEFYIDGKLFSNSMEDKDRGLSDSMSEQDILRKKVYGETAIPAGKYKVTLTYSNKFHSRSWAKISNGKLPLLNNVKGYQGVRIHPLNTAEESLGCIGLGKNNVKGRVTSSAAYYLQFMEQYFLPAIKRNEEVWITIK